MSPSTVTDTPTRATAASRGETAAGCDGDGRTAARVGRLRGRAPDVVALAWVLVAAGAALVPAIAHGASLGPFDLLAREGLTKHAGATIHNSASFDQLEAIIPGSMLAWTQVHHGVLPLWNPYSVLGMPLAFNWQSAPFSVPALVGYLFPLHLAYTAGVVVTLVIAGTGTYALGRVIGLGALGAAMAATVYELSGPFFGWLGWPLASVMSWAGWLFALTILIVRGRRRTRDVVLLAVVVACAVYAGQPEALVLLGGALAVFVVVLAAYRLPHLRGPDGVGRAFGPVVLGIVAGAALGAPLALPGLQLTPGSVRRAVAALGGSPALSSHDLLHVVFQGFDGLPVAGSHWLEFLQYPETAAYVGVIALVLAGLGLGLRRRRPEVVAFGVVAIVAAAVTFVPGVVSVMNHVSVEVVWHRSLVPLAFALSVLAGVGADVIARDHARPAVRLAVAAGFVLAAVLLGVVWGVGRGSLAPGDAALRNRSFIWPVAATALGLVAAVALFFRARVVRARPTGSRRGSGGGALGAWVAGALLAGETAFLVAAGAPLWSSSPGLPTPTGSQRALQGTVGTALVGFGVSGCAQVPWGIGCAGPVLGVLPDYNEAVGLREMVVYDPITPAAYYGSYADAAGHESGCAAVWDVYCPGITTTALARLYGVAFVLEPPGSPGPTGAVFVTRVGDEGLYRVPGAAPATLTPVSGGGPPPDDAPGTPVIVRQADPATWRVVTDAPQTEVLRLRLTAVPGWHATIDGRPVPLGRFARVMLAARVPAGRHVVELHYWPAAFTEGLVLAAGSAVALVGALVVDAARRRSRRAVKARHGPRSRRTA